jgi:hypothetical protein
MALQFRIIICWTWHQNSLSLNSIKISIISRFIDFWTNYCLWNIGIIVNGIRKFIAEDLCFTYLTLEVETGIHTVSDLLFVLFLHWKVFCWTGDSIFI